MKTYQKINMAVISTVESFNKKLTRQVYYLPYTLLMLWLFITGVIYSIRYI